MSYNGRYVGVDMIARRIKDKYAIDIDRDELKGHIYDGIRAVAHYGAYVLKFTDGSDENRNPIEIKNYRGQLPPDMEYPIMARDFDSKMPMNCNDSGAYKSDNILIIPGSSITYNLNYNSIFTNVVSHKVELMYLGFPTDKVGDPLVPDHEEYIKAIAAYGASIKATNMVMKDQLTRDKLHIVEQDWYVYAGGVASLEIPHMDQMDKIVKEWRHLLPKKDKGNTSTLLGIQIDQTSEPKEL